MRGIKMVEQCQTGAQQCYSCVYMSFQTVIPIFVYHRSDSTLVERLESAPTLQKFTRGQTIQNSSLNELFKPQVFDVGDLPRRAFFAQ